MLAKLLPPPPPLPGCWECSPYPPRAPLRVVVEEEARQYLLLSLLLSSPGRREAGMFWGSWKDMIDVSSFSTRQRLFSPAAAGCVGERTAGLQKGKRKTVTVSSFISRTPIDRPRTERTRPRRTVPSCPVLGSTTSTPRAQSKKQKQTTTQIGDRDPYCNSKPSRDPKHNFSINCQ